MFKHPLRIKSQTTVKKSERKALVDQLSTVFESFSSRDTQNLLFPDGADIKTLKVEVCPPAGATGPAKNQKDSSVPDTFTMYCSSKRQPLFFAFDVPTVDVTKKIYQTIILPTVYALWICPTLFTLNFSTVPEVISKLQTGADLMLAGVTVQQDTKDAVENEEKNHVVFPYAAVNLLGKEIPVAVGSLLMDPKELRSRLTPEGELKGRLMKIIHIFGDELWALGDKSQPPSEISAPIAAVDGESAETVTPVALSSALRPEPVENSEETMDALFRNVLLVTLKSKVTDGKLPLLASTLNSLMMSAGRRISPLTLDIKHTSYRKFAKFLDDMEADGLVAVSKVKEGVQAITSISWKHPSFAGVEELPEEPSSSPSIKIPSAIRQVYIVNGRTAPLFTAVHPEMKKGFEFRSTDGIRDVVSSYIKMKDLTSKTDSKVISLDPLLMDLVLNKGIKFQGEWPMKWGELFDKIIKEMTANHEVVFTNGGSIELKGKLIPMDVKIEKKAGNKLITVIRNLEGLGMDPNEIARELQLVVGATVNVREEGGGQNVSYAVTVQGDQTKLLDKFFFQTLSMPKKFVTGLEKPGKKG